MGNIRPKKPRDASEEILSIETSPITSTLKRVQTSGNNTPRNTGLHLSNNKVGVDALRVINAPPASSSLNNILRRNPSSGDLETVNVNMSSIIPQTYNKSNVNETFKIDDTVASGQEFEFIFTNNAVATVDIETLPDGWWGIFSVSDGALVLNSTISSNFVNGNFESINPSYEENLTLFVTYKQEGNRIRITRWV